MKKRRIEVVILSDIHLGNPACQAEELTAYLSSIVPATLVLLGELFDPSYASNKNLPKAHDKVLKKILNFASLGSRVYWIKGLNQTGQQLSPDLRHGNFKVCHQLTLTLDGQKTWILHGSTIARFPSLSVPMMRMGGPGLWMLRTLNRLSQFQIKTSTSAPGVVKGNSRLGKTVSIDSRQKAVCKNAIAKNIHTVVCGYASNPKKDWVEAAEGSCMYLNSGSWMSRQTALEYTFKRWKSYYYCEDKLSAFYADEELKGMDMNQLLSDLSGQNNNADTQVSATSDD